MLARIAALLLLLLSMSVVAWTLVLAVTTGPMFLIPVVPALFALLLSVDLLTHT